MVYRKVSGLDDPLNLALTVRAPLKMLAAEILVDLELFFAPFPRFTYMFVNVDRHNNNILHFFSFNAK